MSNCLPISLKPTGEHFNVPYQPKTTFYDLIKYVCNNSRVLSNANPDDYYLAVNNKYTLDNNQTIEEKVLDLSDQSLRLDVCIKTQVLMKRISQSRMEFWASTDNQTSRKIQQTSKTNKFANCEKDLSIANHQVAPITTDINSNVASCNNEVNILVCGGPKVGKSTLINALCGCPVAKVNTVGLDRCTQKTSYYQLDNIYFWDTPGIDQWSQLDINSYFDSFSHRPQPVCMFYCASPGSFTKLKQLNQLLNECIYQQNIFCVLVVTNMYSNANRYTVLNEFKELLKKYVNHSQDIREEKGIWYYGQIGLCTMVNSEEFIDEDIDRRQQQQGVNELVIAVIQSLRRTHQLDGWLQSIEKNRQFWLDNQETLYKLAGQLHSICLSDLI